MPRRKFDKATSTTFQVVHRPQNDPKIYDEGSGSVVFKELAPNQSHKIKNRRDLESELFSDASSLDGAYSIRDNEGEAAEYGIYYDDTEYDYMQHIRDLDDGDGNADSFFVEAHNHNKEKKGKNKVSLEEALRGASLSSAASESGLSKVESMFGEDATPAMSLRQGSYQAQQDIPDEIAGFKPDMDPRLREVLEALDDDAYVDDEEQFFSQITEDGGEVPEKIFKNMMYEDEEDDDGWESDATEKPEGGVSLADVTSAAIPADEVMTDVAPPSDLEHGDGEWMKEFRKFKQDQKAPFPQSKPKMKDGQQSSILSGASALTSGRKKKRKGALTSDTGYSMTSSSLARTEGQSLLDARFDKFAEAYEEEDVMDMDMDDSVSMFSRNTGMSKMSNLSKMSNVTTSSQAPDLTSQGFESMMDDFLGGYSGKGRGKKGGRPEKHKGMAQLDEVRAELGPARLKVQKAK